ncbi:hypothetical protein BKA62DRAFT_792401 [Auriculariales sp. MPI-PUGE-AT-0066]|nr:hypothetical protein BKA62DRAFT_792401 [Auriculariales sp. MPI-PUGE-AT-0066]
MPSTAKGHTAPVVKPKGPTAIPSSTASNRMAKSSSTRKTPAKASLTVGQKRGHRAVSTDNESSDSGPSRKDKEARNARWNRNYAKMMADTREWLDEADGVVSQPENNVTVPNKIFGDDDDEEGELGDDGDDDDDEPEELRGMNGNVTLVSLSRATGPVPDTQSDDMLTNTRKAASAATTRLFTPYVRRVNPRDSSKPLLKLQSPTSRALLRRAFTLYTAEAIAKDPFAGDESRSALASSSFLAAADQLDYPRRHLRYINVPEYTEDIDRLLRQRDSQRRGQFSSTARSELRAHYPLGVSHGSSDVIAAWVKLALENNNFTFAELTLSADKKNVIKRRGPYRHPIFAEIIFRELFVSHDQAAISELTKHFYNPVPLEVIAFVATAVQCALHDWLEGAQAKTTTEFSADQWSATYDSHVKVLRQLQVAKPREVEAWCTSIYKNCWSSTSAAIVREEDPATAMKLSQEEMDDFDDVHSTV